MKKEAIQTVDWALHPMAAGRQVHSNKENAWNKFGSDAGSMVKGREHTKAS